MSVPIARSDAEIGRRIERHVIEADVAYFKRNPNKDVRLRFAIPGEIPVPLPAECRYMLVLQVDDQTHLRISLDTVTADRLAFTRECWAA